MSSSPNIVFIPGDVSINILEAVKKALMTIRPANVPIKFGGEYLGRTREVIGGLAPGMRKVLSTSLYPIKRFDRYVRPLSYETAEDQAKRVRRELLDAGTTFYGLLKSESRILPKVLHPDEHVEAVVYGQHQSSSVMLVATNERIIFIDKKPMALFVDEVSYEVVSGIEFEIHIFFATLILHTPVKNYDIRFANLHCAEKFTRHIETQRLEKEQPEEGAPPSDNRANFLPGQQNNHDYPIELKEDLAGYYWLPSEEERRRRIQRGE